MAVLGPNKITYEQNKVPSVTVPNFISMHHLLSDQRPVEVHNHLIYSVLAVMAWLQRDVLL